MLKLNRRRSGLLLHPSSLPSVYGIGDFGPSAYGFVDFLAASGQSLWQVLPLGPPDVTGSPYASSSTFAGNWLLISPDLLVRDGLLKSVEGWTKSDEAVHYPTVGKRKAAILERAFRQFTLHATQRQRDSYRSFSQGEHAWLHDVALFSALKEHFGFSVPWTRWPAAVRRRHARALRQWRRTLRPRVEFYAFVQWVFNEQWHRLQRYAHSKGIAIIGDLPIFVTRDSADTWADPKNFMLDGMGRPRLVSGVPPDYFSRRGQVWGDPLYDWKHLKREGYRWWLRRFQRSFDLYDVVRLDHFRGYVAAWGVRAGSRSSRRGSWQPVPGAELLTRAAKVSRRAFIAEDLGIITDDVNALRNQLGFPGVRVVQFGFDDLSSVHALKNISQRSVAYTGTHDNNTTRGWFKHDISRREQRHIKKIIGGTEATVTRRMSEALLRSRANTVILPLQDVLNLGSEARLNTPGTRAVNWQWRFRLSALTPGRAMWLRRLAQKTKRPV